MVKNHLIRVVHYAMLESMPFKTLEQFWQGFPLVFNKKRYSPIETITYLSRYGEVPTRFYMNICSAVEKFYYDNKLDFIKFIENIHLFSTKNSGIDNRTFQFLTKILFAIIKDRNEPLALIFETLPEFIMELYGGYRQTIIKRNYEEQNYSYLIRATCNFVKTKGVDFDHDIFLMPVLKSITTYFDLPQIEDCRVYTDMQKITDILWDTSEFQIKDGKCYIGNNRIGRIEPLSHFLQDLEDSRQHIYDIAGDNDPKVLCIEQDYVCPLRKRIVLHKGRAYGAPFWLFKLSFPQLSLTFNAFENIYYKLQERLLGKNNSPLTCFENLNKDFIKHLEKEENDTICYHTDSEKITINNNIIVKSTPAKILKKILYLNNINGQDTFEYWQFMDDDKIILNKDSHNLSRRIQRLIDALDTKNKNISIEKINRGKLRLKAKRPYSFTIQDN